VPSAAVATNGCEAEPEFDKFTAAAHGPCEDWAAVELGVKLKLEISRSLAIRADKNRCTLNPL
jgi:hypothetical protein